MGGTYIGVGNSSNSVAEFNVATDVESTAAVLMSPYKLKAILPFDVVLAFGCDIEEGKKIFKDSEGSKTARIVHDMFAKVNFEGGFYLCDCTKYIHNIRIGHYDCIIARDNKLCFIEEYCNCD